MFDLDSCDQIEGLSFNSYAEFKKWLVDNHGKNCTRFSSPPIQIFGISEQDEKAFDRFWLLVDRFTSGEVAYCRR